MLLARQSFLQFTQIYRDQSLIFQPGLRKPTKDLWILRHLICVICASSCCKKAGCFNLRDQRETKLYPADRADLEFENSMLFIKTTLLSVHADLRRSEFDIQMDLSKQRNH